MQVLITFIGDALTPLHFIDSHKRKSVAFTVMIEERCFPGTLVGITNKNAGKR